MSRSSFDYAQQQRSNTQTVKRKRKFNTSRFSGFSLPQRTSQTTEVETQDDQPTILQRSIYLLIGCGLLVMLCSIIINKYPTEIKDVAITNGYLLIILPFFTMFYSFIFAISAKWLQAFLISSFFTIILFLKLHAVIIKISLILPLLLIFVIISMFYNRKSKA